MKLRIVPFLLLSLFSIALASQPPSLRAAETKDPAPQKKEDKKEDKAPEEKTVETSHKVIINGQSIKYTAVAGTLNLRKEKDGKFDPVATAFYVAYTRDGTEHLDHRPITYCFNGGPGSSSVWLHMGVLGPKRVLLDNEGNPPPPPARLEDNAYSLLDVSDLVFIDPVSTGYSRPLPGEDPNQFHGLDEDIGWVGEFIRMYTTRHKRWGSPKFLIGESYGTTRASGLSGHLQDQGMYLNGIVLISSVLNFQTLDFSAGNDLPYILYLPTYTATAWYHHVLDPKLQGRELKEVLEESKKFAKGPYASALLEGAGLGDSETKEIAAKVAYYSGLSAEYVERTGLRIDASRYFKELLRREGKTIGRFDSRYTGQDRDSAGESPEYDPSYAAVAGIFTSGFNQYVREDLNFESDLPYEILTGKVHPWNFGRQNGYANVAETLRAALNFNPALKVHVACGYFDLATPFLAAEYTFQHLPLDPQLRKNISFSYYPAGHMMYVRQESLAQLKSNLASFIDSAIPKTP